MAGEEKTIATHQHHGVHAGSCLIIDGRTIVYAGPIQHGPDFDCVPDSADLYLNPEDFNFLQSRLQGRKG